MKKRKIFFESHLDSGLYNKRKDKPKTGFFNWQIPFIKFQVTFFIPPHIIRLILSNRHHNNLFDWRFTFRSLLHLLLLFNIFLRGGQSVISNVTRFNFLFKQELIPRVLLGYYLFLTLFKTVLLYGISFCNDHNDASTENTEK